MSPSMVQQNVVTSLTDFQITHPLLVLRGGESVPSPPGIRFDPLIAKFTPGHEQHPNIIAAMVLATVLKPLAKVYFERLYHIFHRGGDKERKPFDGSQFFQVVETVTEAARLLLLVAVFDIAKTLVLCFGLRFKNSKDLTDVFGWGVYLIWGFQKLSALNLFTLKKIMVNTDIINDPRRVRLLHRLVDYLLVIFGIFVFYEVLNKEMGYSAKGLLTLFSFGSAAVAFATKDIITNFLYGIILMASDRIYEKDIISLDGERKKVNKLGWLETRLRDSDNILYTIPNTQLMSSKMSNLSRVKTCQVRQMLRFPYSAMDKLPQVAKDIKSEIRAACPSIITDGSFPFRCYWINFGSKDLEVYVNAHFRIPPVGDLYFENRQRCLQAIDRAIRKNDIDSYSGGSVSGINYVS